MEEMGELIKNSFSGQSGIVYCLTRDEADRLGKRLEEDGISSAAYHSGLPEGQRIRVQAEWKANSIQVIVATVAFGMGIDKPDVRFVIHSCIPTSFEAYYQQAGRAGRDGKPSKCILFFCDKDRLMASHVINASLTSPMELDESKKPLKQSLAAPESYLDKKREQLDDIIAFAHNHRQCRQVQILQFFNEPVLPGYKCGSCDVCELLQGVPESIPATGPLIKE